MTLARAAQLKQVFGLDLTAADSHRLTERPAPRRARRRTGSARCPRIALTGDEAPSSPRSVPPHSATTRSTIATTCGWRGSTCGATDRRSAVTRFTDDLRAFATAKGVPRLYHATITTAYLTLVAERRPPDPEGPWEAFAGRHGDLLRWKPSVLDDYYSADAAVERRSAAPVRDARLARRRRQAEPRASASRSPPDGVLDGAGRRLVPDALTARGPTDAIVPPDAAHRRPRADRRARVRTALPVAAGPMTEGERQRLLAHLRMTESWLASELAGLSDGAAGVSHVRRLVEYPGRRRAPGDRRTAVLEAGRGLDGQAAAGHAPTPPQATDAGILWYGIDRGNRQRTGEARVPDGRFKTAADGPGRVRRSCAPR